MVQQLPKSIGWVKILKVVGTHTQGEQMEREKLLLSRGPFSNLVLDFHLKGPNVFFIDIILKLLMASKQSMMVNKVSVLMPSYAFVLM